MSAVYLSIHPSVFSRSPASTGFAPPSFFPSSSWSPRWPLHLSGPLLLDDPVMAAAAPFGRWFGRRRWNRARFQSVQLYATGGNDGRRRRTADSIRRRVGETLSGEMGSPKMNYVLRPTRVMSRGGGKVKCVPRCSRGRRSRSGWRRRCDVCRRRCRVVMSVGARCSLLP